MAVPTNLSDLSTTAASNSPSGSDSIGTSLDDYLRSIQAIIAKVGNGTNALTTPALGAATATTINGVTINSSILKTTDIGTLVQPFNAAALDTTDIGVLVQAYSPAMLTTTDIGTLVQAYDADIATVSASQAEMEAGTEAALRSVSPLRVAQSVSALTPNKMTLATLQATTSGTSKDFNSIPTGTKRITLMMNGVSTNGTSGLRIQIGDSGGIENTGYYGGSYVYNGFLSSSAGIDIWHNNVANAFYGAITLTLMDATSNTWVFDGNPAYLAGANYELVNVGGVKALSARLESIRLTTVNGSDAFDAGSVNILYE